MARPAAHYDYLIRFSAPEPRRRKPYMAKNAGRKDYHIENYNTKIVNQDVNDPEKDLNIELREEEPPFLKGLTSKTNTKNAIIIVITA